MAVPMLGPGELLQAVSGSAFCMMVSFCAGPRECGLAGKKAPVPIGLRIKRCER
jgi:hypothetical protein